MHEIRPNCRENTDILYHHPIVYIIASVTEFKKTKQNNGSKKTTTATHTYVVHQCTMVSDPCNIFFINDVTYQTD